MENREIVANELDAVKELRNNIYLITTKDYLKDLDIIENGLQELADTIDALEKKCATHDYWRDLVRKQDELLEIIVNKDVNITAIKNLDTLEKYNSNLLNVFTKTSAKKRYLTQSEFDLLRKRFVK